ncbi:MAG: HEAT repeat domain-containing protein, partial [Vicinamibacteria bacterium]|nr:HEAT repeat domain-containing protein [Vicinamibacteria bacterium]
MLSLILLLVLQSPAERAILEVEYNRAEDVSALLKALQSPDVRLQSRAARTAGRLERPALGEAVIPLLRSSDVGVRREAIGALAQMKAFFDFGALIGGETDGSVRAVIYEAMGRAMPGRAESEAPLVLGLKDKDQTARRGAARGLESRIRLNLKTARPDPATIKALREAIRDSEDSRLRQFALLALNAAGDQDPATFDIALLDGDPQVRRLAVLGSKRWVEDRSPMVRLEAMRLAGTCEKAFLAIRNQEPSGHVVLAAVDRLGTQVCDPLRIAQLVDQGKDWRIRARALVSLAKVAPALARERLPRSIAGSPWQARAYAATVAALLKDQAALEVLVRDPDQNVAAEAMTTFDDAVRALSSDHSGLLLASAAKLLGSGELKSVAPMILATIKRLTRAGRATLRDPRQKLIEVLGTSRDLVSIEGLRPLLDDRDPAVALAAANVLSEATGKPVTARTIRYVPEPLPSGAALRSLDGATAVIRMKDLGPMTLQLLPDESPATVATFAELAEAGAYNGLTIHRVVPNFVLQGGSPGANEYDALTPQFMRDELGFTSNERGTFGISTRGHDTG